MFDEIQIRNFQAHDSLDLELSPGVNTIIGPTDTGKSAIIRAIRLACLNLPSGTAFIKDGERRALVRIITGSDRVVRSRSKSENLYRLNKKKFEAFGSGKVPPEITDTLNISPVNFQQQHDSPFWFSESAGEVSRQLNRIVDLDVIDRTLGNLDSMKRYANTEKTLIKQRLKELSERKKELEYVGAMEEALDGLERRDGRNRKLAAKCEILADLISAHRKASREADRLRAAESRGRSVLEKARLVVNLRERAGTLEKLIRRHQTISPIIEMKPPEISHLIKRWNSIRNLEIKKARLSELIENWREAFKGEKHWLKIYKDGGKTLKKEIGKVCPLCGKPTK